MAVTLNIQNTEVGVAFDAAYARINNISITNEIDGGMVVMVCVCFYATQEARQSASRPVAQRHFDLQMPEGNFMEGLYTQLKAFPEFSGAEDC